MMVACPIMTINISQDVIVYFNNIIFNIMKYIPVELINT